MSKYDSTPDGYTKEEWRLARRKSLSDESGLYRLSDFVRCMDEGKHVEQDTMEYFHNVFSLILADIQITDEFTYRLKTEDSATGETLARHLNLWAGKTLRQQSQEQQDISLSWESVRPAVESERYNKSSQKQIIAQMATERGITAEKGLEAFRKKFSRAMKRLNDDYRK